MFRNVGTYNSIQGKFLSHLRLSIRSINSGESGPIVSVQHIVAGDVLVEERAALHHHAIHRFPSWKLHLDVLVCVLDCWIPAAG